jgi:multiple sugar transport system substrate-binding protein
MRMRARAVAAVVATLAVAVLAGCGGGNDNSSNDKAAGGNLKGSTVTVWSYEGQPDRIKALEDDLAGFTQSTGIKTKVVAIPDGQLTTLVTNSAAAGKLPDVLAAISATDALNFVKQGVFDPSAAEDVVNNLGRDTFSKNALELATADGKVAAVPSDGWGQLLIYRSDLFKKAGLSAPKTVEDILADAKKLNRPGMAGIVLATKPGDEFTTQSFQHLALAEGCQLVDNSGNITIDSPQCVKALTAYAQLARSYSVSATRTSTRRAARTSPGARRCSSGRRSCSTAWLACARTRSPRARSARATRRSWPRTAGLSARCRAPGTRPRSSASCRRSTSPRTPTSRRPRRSSST